MKKIILSLLIWMGVRTSLSGLMIPRHGLTASTTYYHHNLKGRIMANGLPFNPDALTCAHPSLPFGTQLMVTCGLRSVVVTVTDRTDGRTDLDLSRRAFAELAPLRRGRILTEVRIINYLTMEHELSRPIEPVVAAITPQ